MAGFVRHRNTASNESLGLTTSVKFLASLPGLFFLYQILAVKTFSSDLMKY
jgi:hypothetical protein